MMKNDREAFGNKNPPSSDLYSTEESELGVSFLLAQNDHEA